jgi:hypothetical protein
VTLAPVGLVSPDPPWYQSDDVIGGVLGAIIGASLAALYTVLMSRRAQKAANRTQDELKKARAEIARLRAIARSYELVKDKLRGSTVVSDYEQPVLLLGPRYVGKSSLMMQWHAPWDHAALPATATHRSSAVPVHDFLRPGTVPHFADPDVLTQLHAHLRLMVHDFPGELRFQRRAMDVAQRESERLQRELRLDLGVVLVCLCDAREAGTGRFEAMTREYYNGDLFQGLRGMVAERRVSIQRLIIVYNKFDMLRSALPAVGHDDLLKLCSDNFHRAFPQFHDMCHPEKVYETMTILDRSNMALIQGPGAVLGEAARGLVEGIVGRAEAAEIIGQIPEQLNRVRPPRVL